jgi:DNA-binding beta-propeller fold protein YncE
MIPPTDRQHRMAHAANAVALALLLAACATAPELKKLVWPAPPQTARIEFVRSISSDENVGRDVTFEEKALQLLTGQRAPANHLAEPMGIAVSDDGERVYVSDYAQLAVFIFDFKEKKFLKIGKETPLGRPLGITLDADENIYVVEQIKKSISVFSRNGEPLRSITDPSIDRPGGLAIDRQRGRLYVADTSHTKTGHHDVKIFDLQGNLTGTLGQGKGSADGYFLFPTFVWVDAGGHVFVSDTLNSRVQEFDADGKFVARYGQRGSAWGMFDKPKGVATDTFGNVYVVDSGWSNVQIFNRKAQVLLFFGGRGKYPGLLQNPTAITIDKRNRIYVADYLNHRVEVYQLANTSATDSFANPTPIAGPGPAAMDAAARAAESAAPKDTTDPANPAAGDGPEERTPEKK